MPKPRLRQPLLQGCVVGTLIWAAVAATQTLPAQAQSDGNPSVRAANLARMKAERLNGGLGVYRPAPCMFEQGGGPCLVSRGSKGFTFRFLGGQPGWRQLGIPPTVETEILVSPDGRSVLEVIYNGPVREAMALPGLPTP